MASQLECSRCFSTNKQKQQQRCIVTYRFVLDAASREKEAGTPLGYAVNRLSRSR